VEGFQGSPRGDVTGMFPYMRCDLRVSCFKFRFQFLQPKVKIEKASHGDFVSLFFRSRVNVEEVSPGNFLAVKKDLTLEDILSSLFWTALLCIKVANCS
jgi:hypothetical protein